MQFPSLLQGESLTRLLQGTAVGAIGAIVVGFNWGGWILESTANKQATNDVRSAVALALAPHCVEKFQQGPDVVVNLAKLKEASVFQQARIVEEGGWAILAGGDKSSAGVAKACAEILVGSEAL